LLLLLIQNPEVPDGIKQSSAVYFKNFAKQRWNPQVCDSFALPRHTGQFFRIISRFNFTLFPLRREESAGTLLDDDGAPVLSKE
jgi:hypothetical protein